jgi:macrolide transport system ATP-binding/permease protein
MHTLWQDVRFASRMLRKNTGFTAIAVLTLALGIGANTAIFSVVNSLLLRPLPVKDPGQLMVLGFRQDHGPAIGQTSYPEWESLAQQPDSPFSSLIGHQLSSDGLSVNGKAYSLLTNYVTANYFEALGLRPTLGRFFLPSEGKRPGADPVIVLGYSLWKAQLGGDSSIVGSKVLLDGHPFTVIGVAPKGFHGLASIIETDAFLPFSMAPILGTDPDVLTSFRTRNVKVLGRARRGVDLEQARAALSVEAQGLAQRYPEIDKNLEIEVYPERRARPDPIAANQFIAASALFLSLAALALLLACVNVANILLVRGTTRQREMAIRAALGGTRTRLIRSLLTESVLLALLGGAAGIFLGEWLSALIGSIDLQTNLPVVIDFSFDGRVFAYALAAALLTGIVVGIVPALRASRGNLNAILHESGRSVAVGHNWLRSALVVGQVAGSLMLLIVAGLLTRSMAKAQHLDLGFDPTHVLNLTMDPNTIGYHEAQARLFFHRLLDQVRTLPGIESASLAFSVPMGYYSSVSTLQIEDYVPSPNQAGPVSQNNMVSPGYFRTMRIAILSGRDFNDSDREDTQFVAIVNESMARRYWPDKSPIGRHFNLAEGYGHGKVNHSIEVIGVAHDSYANMLSGVQQPFFYLPLSQDYTSIETLQVRTTQAPETMITPLQKQIASLAPGLPIFNVETMTQGLYTLPGFLIFQIGAGFALALGLIGLVLAIVGVYGVISHVTAQRIHEIGVRMALGAQQADVLRLVFRQGLFVVAVGLATGLLAAAGAARVMRSFLVGVGPGDPLTYAIVSLLLVSVALLACWIPARRATRVDPLVALRYE